MDLFFDAHLHLTLKNQFSKGGNSTSPWKAITRNDLKDGLPELLKLFGLGTLDKTFSSQSSPDQLIRANYRLVVCPLFAPDVDLVRAISSKKIFMKILKRFHNTNFGMVLSFERYGELGNENNPFSIVENDLRLLVQMDPADPSRSLVFLKKASDFRSDTSGQLGVVFSIEGLHSLRSDLTLNDEDQIFTDIKTNLEKLLARGLTVVMANLTHIDNCNRKICNQAYAMDGMRSNGFKEKALRPVGHGLPALGRRLVDLLESHWIAVDIKHTSVLARRELYAFRKESGITSPLVSSHSGIAGIPFDSPEEGFRDYIFEAKKQDRVQQIKVAKVVKYKFPKPFVEVGFNATSISLFDEDIQAIYESDGLLGISMDERVLGYSRAHKLDPEVFSDNVGLILDSFGNRKRVMLDRDYISNSEFEHLGLNRGKRGSKLKNTVDAEELIKMVVGNSTNVPPYQFFHFLNHVFHCVVLADRIDGPAGVEKILTRILCVGSDFDGLIDAMDLCLNCSQSNSIKMKFIEEFPEILALNHLQLPSGLSIQTVADRLFYENGRDFVLRSLELQRGD